MQSGRKERTIPIEEGKEEVNLNNNEESGRRDSSWWIVTRTCEEPSMDSLPRSLDSCWTGSGGGS